MVAETDVHAMLEPTKGEYRKIQELASGGMGSVDLVRVVGGAHDGRIVALKRLHPHLEREKHFAQMFFDEARITAGLHHANVVEILDWGRDTQGHYLALEYVAGDSLLGLIREAKRVGVPIPVGLALFILGRTAEGLHAAHELRNEDGELQHLVHRDVTPSNILVGIDGSVKLIDFGVAKAKDKLSHTNTGTIKGKFGYMSPEQARGFPIDRRSDVFSLGIVLWETLALKRLYRSESELEILRMIVDDPPRPIRELRPDVPVSVESLLMAMLAKSRDDRLGSCGEVADFIWASYEEQGYRETEGDLIEFFRHVMPERFHAVQQLLSGGSEFIEPTVARPASGSFSGLLGEDDVSGAVPRRMMPPMPQPDPRVSLRPGAPTLGFNDSVSVLPVVGQPGTPRRSHTLLLALAAAGVIALIGTAVAVGTRPAHTAAPGAPVEPRPAAPAVAMPVQPAPVVLPAVVPSVTPPASVPVRTSEAPVVRTGTSGHHHDHGSSTRGNVTLEQTRNAMLNGTGDPHPGSTTTSSSASPHASASSTASEPAHTTTGTTAATPPTHPAGETRPAGGSALTFGGLLHAN